MLHAIGVLIRARLQIARNTFWRGKIWRKILLILGVVGLGFASYGLYWLARTAVRAITSPRFAEILQEIAREQPELNFPTDIGAFLLPLPSIVLFWALVFLILTSFTTVLSSLYLSGDLDMLLVAPVPMRAVFVVKFFGGLIIPYIMLFFFLGPFLLGFGHGLGFGIPYFITGFIVLLLLPLLPTGFGALLVMAVVRVIPARRAREIVGVIGGLLGASWYIINQFAPQIAPRIASVQTLDSLRSLDLPLLPSAWAGRALIAAGQGEWLTLLVYGGLFAILSIGIFAGCLMLAERLYYVGWSNMATQGGRVRTKNREPRTERRPSVFGRVPSGWFAFLGSFLPPESQAILYKDLRVFPRDLRNVQQLIFPIVLAGIWTFQLLAGGTSGGRDSEFERSVSGLSSAGISFFICLTLSSALGGPSISREGKGFWLLKVAPISAWRLLIGKLALAYLPFPIIGTLFVIFLSILQRSAPLDVVRSLALLWLAGLGTSSITLGLGAAFPKLVWDNPQKQTSWQAGCLAPILYMTYIAIALGVALGVPALVAAFQPQLATLLTVVAWAILIALTAAVVWGALALGASRLERLEVT